MCSPTAITSRSRSADRIAITSSPSRGGGRDAAIVAVAKSFAAFTQGGRAWPIGEAFEGAVDLKGYGSRPARTSCGSRICSAAAGRGAEGETHRAAEAGAKALLARTSLDKRAEAARDQQPDGLADVVPTRRSVPFSRALHRWSGKFVTEKLYDNLPRRIFRRCKAQQIAVHQPRLVSSRLPRLLIAACATSAKRCSSQGSMTSTRT